MRRNSKILYPSASEEVKINEGIALDPDNPELSEKQFQEMRSAREVVPSLVQDYKRRARGPQIEPTKRPVSIRLDPDVLDKLREHGKGWQSHANALLRKAVGL